MADHFIEKCSCGVVLNQCRCMAPDKTVIIKQNACGNCQNPDTIKVLRGRLFSLHNF
jgi:cytochrome c551/c552